MSFFKPKELFGDRTPSAMVIQHAIKQLNNKNKKGFFQYIVLLQLNITFKEGTRLGQKYKDFDKKNEASSLVSVTEVEDNHPARMYYMKDKYLLKNKLSEKNSGAPRQSLKNVLRNGAIYI